MSYKNALLANTSIILKADTGASGNYIRLKDAIILKNKKLMKTGPKVRLPNNSVITSTTEGYLPFNNLPKNATQAHIFPDIKSASLLSIGQLCDSNCTAIFTKTDLTVLNEAQDPVLNGIVSFSNKLSAKIWIFFKHGLNGLNLSGALLTTNVFEAAFCNLAIFSFLAAYFTSKIICQLQTFISKICQGVPA